MGCGCKNRKKPEEMVAVENVVVEKPIKVAENDTTVNKENNSGESVSE